MADVMSRTVTISDDLAALVEARQRAGGHPSIDAAAEALIALGLIADAGENHSAGRSDDELRALVDEAEASGAAEPWDAAEAKAEVLRRFAVHRSK
jgi:hypothetical protein